MGASILNVSIDLREADTGYPYKIVVDIDDTARATFFLINSSGRQTYLGAAMWMLEEQRFRDYYGRTITREEMNAIEHGVQKAIARE